MAAIAELIFGLLFVGFALVSWLPRAKHYLLNYLERNYFFPKGSHYRVSQWFIEHHLVPIVLLVIGLGFIANGVQDL